MISETENELVEPEGITVEDVMDAQEAADRAIVVDELRELGVISEKKARKRLMKLAKFLPSLYR